MNHSYSMNHYTIGNGITIYSYQLYHTSDYSDAEWKHVDDKILEDPNKNILQVQTGESANDSKLEDSKLVKISFDDLDGSFKESTIEHKITL